MLHELPTTVVHSTLVENWLNPQIFGVPHDRWHVERKCPCWSVTPAAHTAHVQSGRRGRPQHHPLSCAALKLTAPRPHHLTKRGMPLASHPDRAMLPAPRAWWLRLH